MSSKDTPASMSGKKSRFDMIYMLYVIPAFFFVLPIALGLGIAFMNYFVFPSGLTHQEASLEETALQNPIPFVCDIMWKLSIIGITIFILVRNIRSGKWALYPMKPTDKTSKPSAESET